ncbi:MAG: glycosyltransferase family 2 protein [Pseudomonadota bacterium]
MNVFDLYKLRLERKDMRYRALHRGRKDLSVVKKRIANVPAHAVLLFSVIRNERQRLPFFLDYYRKLGVQHFCFIDNQSEDDTQSYLVDQPDVSVWNAQGSYRRAAYGVHWLNCLMGRYGKGHWCLTVDADEFFVYPHCDNRPIQALTDWLDAQGLPSFGTILLDLYSDRDISETVCVEGESPINAAPYFDGGNYSVSYNPKYRNIWLQGGPRQRVFFSGKPEQAPSLNKIPLVKWRRGYVYMHSTHHLLPAKLNLTYAQEGGQKASGALLHTKFTQSFLEKVSEEETRQMHYKGSQEYKLYAQAVDRGTPLHTENSIRFKDWRQLQSLGLVSQAGWA